MRPLTGREVLERYIANDVRNLASVGHERRDLALRVIADCATRHVEALDFGDRELLRQTEGNLRVAVKDFGWAR